MELKIQFDEEKMREIVAEAVAKLKAEGYIWRDKPTFVLPDTPTFPIIENKQTPRGK